MDFYPKLLEYFNSKYTKVNSIEEITYNSYIIKSGNGYPHVFNKMSNTLNTISDFNKKSRRNGIKIDFLVLVIDADYYDSLSAARQGVEQRLRKLDSNIKEAKIKVKYIIQNQCIESWFLGNRAAFPQKYNEEFSKFVKYFNVKETNPEKMKAPYGSGVNNAHYALDYLQSMLRQTGNEYAKSKTDYISTPEYISEIYERYLDGDLKSFGDFIKVSKNMNSTYTNDIDLT